MKIKVLVAAQAPWIREQIEGSISSDDITVQCVSEGSLVRQAIIDFEPDVLIADMQSGNMGGIAVAIDARMEAEEGRCKDVAIVLLLDRQADRLLAERANVDATIVKPLDIVSLNRIVKELAQFIQNERSEESEITDSGDDDLDVFDDEGIPVHIN